MCSLKNNIIQELHFRAMAFLLLSNMITYSHFGRVLIAAITAADILKDQLDENVHKIFTAGLYLMDKLIIDNSDKEEWILSDEDITLLKYLTTKSDELLSILSESQLNEAIKKSYL